MLKCGAYEKQITPKLGSRIPGYFEERISEDVLDELMVKALVFDDGKNTVGFCELDILHVRADMTKKIRERFALLTGVYDAKIMVAGTHAHTGEAVEENDEFALPDENSINATCEKSADALALAWKRRRECRVGFGSGIIKDMAFNRRFWKKDGKVHTWPGRCNPDNVREAAAVDEEVAVVRIDSPTGEPIAVITNFANHLDLIGGCKFSADYPGVLSEKIKSVLGENVVSVFMNGCCGDVTHINYNTTEPYPSDYYITVGKRLGEKVLEIYGDIHCETFDSVSGESDLTVIPRRQPTKEMYERGKREIAEFEQRKAQKKEQDGYGNPSTGNADLMALSYSKCNVNLYENPKLSETVETQVIRVGNIVFNGMPGEMFAEIGLDIKEKSEYSRNINVELANGCYGYIATKKAFSEGGYEVTLDRYVNMSEDTADIMTKSILDLQKRV